MHTIKRFHNGLKNFMTTANQLESGKRSIDFETTNDDTTKFKGAVSEESPANGGLLSCWTVMAKTMIGVGLLGLSCATAKCGWFLGLLLLFIAGAAAMFTLHLLNCMIMSSSKRHVSFYSISERVAPWCKLIVDIAIALKCFGVGTAYFQVYGSQLAQFIQAMNPSVNNVLSSFALRSIVILVGFVAMIPVCFRKRVSKTAVINVFGILGISYIVLISIVYVEVDVGVTSVWPVGTFAEITAKIPIFIFTFTCHQNMFLVGEDMADRTQKKLDAVAFLAELVGACLFIPALVCPYITYGSLVNSNFLESMGANVEIGDSPAVLCGGLALAIAEISAFPLQLFPCRKSVIVLISRGRDLVGNQEKHFRRAVTAIILIVTSIVAIFVTDLGITLSLVGIIGSNTICFIMPSFLYCKSFARQGPKWYASAAVFVVSSLLLPICLTAILFVAAAK